MGTPVTPPLFDYNDYSRRLAQEAFNATRLGNPNPLGTPIPPRVKSPETIQSIPAPAPPVPIPPAAKQPQLQRPKPPRPSLGDINLSDFVLPDISTLSGEMTPEEAKKQRLNALEEQWLRWEPENPLEEALQLMEEIDKRPMSVRDAFKASFPITQPKPLNASPRPAMQPQSDDFYPYLSSLLKEAGDYMQGPIENRESMPGYFPALKLVGRYLDDADLKDYGSFGLGMKFFKNTPINVISSVLSASDIREITQAPEKFFQFYEKVRSFGEYDIKNWPEYSTKYKSGVPIAGKSYRPDVPGNLLYGYAGAASGMSISVLLKMAGLAQYDDDVAHGRPTRNDFDNYDDIRDQWQIMAGYRLYDRFRKYGASESNLRNVLGAYIAE
jgi:hypothetical protein